MSELNDKELFESAISDTPPVETNTEEPAQETAQAEQVSTEGQPRDDKGRFAQKAAEAEAATAQAAQPAQATSANQQPDSAAHVPSWRLREVNEAKEEAERRRTEAENRAAAFEREMAQMRQQLAQMQQPKAEPVDFFADPNAAFRQQIDPIQQQFNQALQNQKFQFSEMLARQAIGDQKADEIKQWAMSRMNDPSLNARVERSTHPWGELIKSYQEHQTLSEIGTDPNAYVQKKLDEALKDPAFLAKALEAAKAQASGQAQPNGKPQTAVQIPPSLNRAASAGSPHDQLGSMSDRDLYSHAIR